MLLDVYHSGGTVRGRQARWSWMAVLCALALVPLTGASPALASRGLGGVAPLNPAFVQWDAAGEGRRGVDGSGVRLPGLIPDPSDPSGVGRGVLAPRGVAYPATFDLRDEGHVTAVKDQSPFGTCWAFAAVSALESALLPGDTLDVSEDHVTLEAGFDMAGDPYGHGGNFSMTTAYFVRWDGPVLESLGPLWRWGESSGLEPVRRVQEVLYVPGGSSGTDNENIKYAVMEFGAVAAEIYFGKRFFNETTKAHYYYGTEYPNHAVAIVGWDDSYPATDFMVNPPGDGGAWLVKNNWGPGTGVRTGTSGCRTTIASWGPRSPTMPSSVRWSRPTPTPTSTATTPWAR